MLVFFRPVIPLLLINFLGLSSSSSSSSSSSQNATRPRSHSSGRMNDYDDYSDYTTTRPSLSSTNSEFEEPSQCDYNMCVEQQQTCADLAKVTDCLCPGLSNRFLPPSPPRELSLIQLDNKSVVVHWCAPTSVVTYYNVLVKGKDKVVHKDIRIEERKRSKLLEDVAAGAIVCVKAVNEAGVSAENGNPCVTFEPQCSDSGLALKLGIIGGVVGLIVLLILILLLWRHKTRQKSTARNGTGEFCNRENGCLCVSVCVYVYGHKYAIHLGINDGGKSMTLD